MTKFEDHNGELFNGVVVVNGYIVGDRLLEDVFFHADIINGEINLKSVRVAEDCEDYFETLNKNKWLKEARLFFESETEAFETIDGDHIFASADYFYDEAHEIEVFSLDDILRGN